MEYRKNRTSEEFKEYTLGQRIPSQGSKRLGKGWGGIRGGGEEEGGGGGYLYPRTSPAINLPGLKLHAYKISRQLWI